MPCKFYLWGFFIKNPDDGFQPRQRLIQEKIVGTSIEFAS